MENGNGSRIGLLANGSVRLFRIILGTALQPMIKEVGEHAREDNQKDPIEGACTKVEGFDSLVLNGCDIRRHEMKSFSRQTADLRASAPGSWRSVLTYRIGG